MCRSLLADATGTRPRRVIVVTGAAGFLGSALTVDLARDHTIVAVDRREPTRELREAAPGVLWKHVDIAERDALVAAFDAAGREIGRVDFVVHFAAFYHFGADWRREYSLTNVQGTENVIHGAMKARARRLIFASSVAAMRPAAPGTVLDERSPTDSSLPYGRSKSIGERIVRDASDRLPAVVLRIGGAFSDWCELPPLYSLIRLWSGRSALSRILVGEGNTGFPYIHREDLVLLVRSCIERNEEIERHQVFLASQRGAVRHRDLFPIVRKACRGSRGGTPIFLPPGAARAGLLLRLAAGRLICRRPFERMWMLKYIDRPWVVDTARTRKRLGWSCTAGMRILERLPEILNRFTRDRSSWERRNRLRNEGLYAYH